MYDIKTSLTISIMVEKWNKALYVIKFFNPYNIQQPSAEVVPLKKTNEASGLVIKLKLKILIIIIVYEEH